MITLTTKGSGRSFLFLTVTEVKKKMGRQKMENKNFNGKIGISRNVGRERGYSSEKNSVRNEEVMNQTQFAAVSRSFTTSAKRFLIRRWYVWTITGIIPNFTIFFCSY